jgi:hypothetical protein
MKKRKTLEFGEQLASIPMKNEKAKELPGAEPDTLVVEIELRYSGLMSLVSKMFKLIDRKRYVLDGVGKQVYESVDGKKSFEMLIDDFAARHKLTFFEGRALLMQYIKILMGKGIVVIGIRRR